MHSRTFRFEVSLSFPGEYRDRVQEIAFQLAKGIGREKVLYDQWYSAEFARPNLNVYLPDLYHQQSRLLVFFLGGKYVEKEWCGLEWRAGLDLLKRKEDDRLMLLRIDNAEIPGLYSIDGYLDISRLADKDVAREILKRLTTEIDKVVPGVRAQAHHDIRSRCGTIRILTMEQPIELGGIYTEVNILPRRPANLRKTLDELIAAAGVKGFDRFGISTEPIKRLPAVTALDSHQHLLIYGKPGSGKTTFLKRLAIECANGNLRPELVPVFVTLKDFAEADGSPTLLSYIERQWDGNPNSQVILRVGRALALLDGLDEVRDQDFVRVRRAIEAFTTEFYHCTIVLTCRIAAREYAFERFTEVEMADFTKPQIKAFAARWFDLQGEKRKASNFMKKLEANSPVLELASSPLLLTLLCLVFQERNDFGGTRAELYQEGLDILLRKWDAKRGVERDRPYGLSITNMETLLREIAYSHYIASEYFFDQGGLEAQIENFFSERELLEPRQELVPGRVLNSIESHLGLLVQRAVRVYSFSHLTFQEYLTAERIAKKRTLLEEISPYVGDRRWREVWLLLVTMLDEEDIVPELKKRVDMLVQSRRHIQSYLRWCREKVEAMPPNRNPVGVRALYLGLGNILNQPLDLDRLYGLDDRQFDRSLSLDVSHAMELAVLIDSCLADAIYNDGNLALEYAVVFVFALSDALGRALAFDTTVRSLSDAQNLARCLARALARAVDRAVGVARRAAPDLEIELSALRADVPGLLAEVRNEVSRERWRQKWSQWSPRLRATLSRHLNIGRDWKFSDREKGLLVEYYRANLLLVECVNVARGLTNKTRTHIEQTMLLPWGGMRPSR